MAVDVSQSGRVARGPLDHGDAIQLERPAIRGKAPSSSAERCSSRARSDRATPSCVPGETSQLKWERTARDSSGQVNVTSWTWIRGGGGCGAAGVRQSGASRSGDDACVAVSGALDAASLSEARNSVSVSSDRKLRRLGDLGLGGEQIPHQMGSMRQQLLKANEEIEERHEGGGWRAKRYSRASAVMAITTSAKSGVIPKPRLAKKKPRRLPGSIRDWPPGNGPVPDRGAARADESYPRMREFVPARSLDDWQTSALPRVSRDD